MRVTSDQCLELPTPTRPAVEGRRAVPLLAVATATGSLGLAAGGTAAALVAAATVGSFPVMLAGSVLLGVPTPPSSCRATRQPASAAGVRAAGPLGTVLFATSLGTVAGPTLLVPTGGLAGALGLPRLTGLYLVAVAAFAAAALVVAGLSRGRLPELGREARVAGPGRDRPSPRSVRPRHGPPCWSWAGPTWSWWRSWRWPPCSCWPTATTSGSSGWP